MKKKILIICIIVVLLALFIALGASKNVVNNDEEYKLNILTTFYPVNIFAQNVVDGIDDVRLKNLDIKSDGCLHGYQLTTGNMKDIEKADVIIINGAEMEKSFIYDIKEMYPQKTFIDTSAGIELLNSSHENEVNSHIWLSITNAKIQVENITKGLCQVDDENAYTYTENSKKYINELDKLYNQYEKREINVVAMHDSISYFAKDLGLNVIDIIQSGEEDVPTQKRITEIVQNMKANDVKAILLEKNYSDKFATLLSSETGVEVYYFESITSGDAIKEDYITKMKYNYDIINKVR